MQGSNSYFMPSIFDSLSVSTLLLPSGLREADSAAQRSSPESSTAPSGSTSPHPAAPPLLPPLSSRLAFQQTPSSVERAGGSAPLGGLPTAAAGAASAATALAYMDVLGQDPASALLLPRPQAVGSPGHPSPSLGLGNGDGSSSDSLDRQAAGQEEDEDEDDEDDDEDEDSSEYENLVSMTTATGAAPSPLSAEVLSMGRPPALRPDGDTQSSPTS